MSGNATAVERLLEVSNQLWDAMYESGEVPTYEERAHYYLALKDAMTENDKLRELLQEAVDAASMRDITDWPYGKRLRLVERARELGIEVD